MKRKFTALAFLSTLALSGPVLADGWTMFQFKNDGWKPEMTLALAVGSMDVKNIGTAEYQGAELSLNCPWFQPPAGSIRQQFNIGTYENGNASLTSFEMNPTYYVSVAPGWTIGAGPGIGYINGYVGNKQADMSSIQVSASVNYRNGHFFAGAGARYQDSLDKEIVPGVKGMDNWLLSAKVGINF
jgi:hypothetical protein